MLIKFLTHNLNKEVDLRVGFDAFNGKLIWNGATYMVGQYKFTPSQVSTYGYLDKTEDHPYIVVTGR